MPWVHDLEWQRARSRAERMLSREQRWQLTRTRAMRVLEKYDPDQPRDEEGKWTSGGGNGGGTNGTATSGGARPQVRTDKGGSAQGAKRVEAAIAAIPAKHAEILKDVPVEVVSLSKDISGLGTAAGMYSYLPAEFGGGNRQIQIAEKAGWDEKYAAPFKSLERTTVHELGHAFDHHTNFKHGKDVVQDAMKGLERLNMVERNDSAYFFTNARETFAELYAVAHSPDKSAKYFGGLSLDRAETVFTEALAKVRAL